MNLHAKRPPISDEEPRTYVSEVCDSLRNSPFASRAPSFFIGSGFVRLENIGLAVDRKQKRQAIHQLVVLIYDSVKYLTPCAYVDALIKLFAQIGNGYAASAAACVDKFATTNIDAGVIDISAARGKVKSIACL